MARSRAVHPERASDGGRGRLVRAAAVVALVGALAACTGGGGGTESSGSAGGAQEDTVSREAAPAPAAPLDETSDREVVTTGSLTLEVPDAAEAAEDASRVVAAAGGRVDDWSEQDPGDDEPASAYLTVRIPADAFLDTVEELQALGDVRDLSLSRQDVTLQVTDLDARIAALEVSIARLEGLMREATSVADLLTAEEALTERQAELDSLRARRASLAEQVDLSTLYLSLLPRQTAPSPSPGGFWGGVQTGWAALVSAFNQLLVVLGVLVPWIVLAGIVLAVVLVVRAVRPARPRPPGPSRPGVVPPPGAPGSGQVPPPGAPGSGQVPPPGATPGAGPHRGR